LLRNGVRAATSTSPRKFFEASLVIAIADNDINEIMTLRDKLGKRG
jgi:hypothetical protein